MKGKELVALIEKNGWHNSELWLSKDGVTAPVTMVEMMFPELKNTEVVISDGKDIHTYE